MQQMKKIALISTFCNTKEKQNMLRKAVKAFKSEGIDVMCLSPNSIHLPLDIVEESDFVFFTQENPILKWPVKSFTHWRTLLTDKGWVKMVSFQDDYGWADLYQRKKLMEIGLTFDYDIFYNVIYDTEISKELLQEIKNNNTNQVYPVLKPYKGWIFDSSLQFMVFDRELTQKVLKEITLEKYLSKPSNFAEDIVVEFQNKLNIPTKGSPVKELNYLHENIDYFNYSINNDYSLFVNKGEDGNNKEKLKILFHNINLDGEVVVKINNFKHVDVLTKGENKLIELNIECNKISKFNILFNEKNYDFTEKYSNISKTHIDFV